MLGACLRFCRQNGLLRAPCPKWGGIPKRTPTCTLPKMERRSKTDFYMHGAQNGTAFQNGLLYAPCKKMNGVPKLDSMTCTHACKRVGLERGWRRGMGKGGVVSNRWPIYFAKNVGPCSSNTYLICGVFWGLTEYICGVIWDLTEYIAFEI